MSFLRNTEPNDLKIVEELSNNQTITETFTVPDGKIARVTLLTGDIEGTENSVIKGIWDFGGAGEEIFWVIAGDGLMPFVFEATGDGIKKLALQADNGSGGSRWFSAFMRIAVED